MTPEHVRTVYARALSLYETIQIRRYTGSGASRAPVDYPVRARVMNYDGDELIGGIVQGRRRVIVLAEDVENSDFALPFVSTADKLVIRGREVAITAVDDNTRRFGGVLMAYEILAAG